MESSFVSSNCVCHSTSCKSTPESSYNYNDNCIEEYCLDNIDDISDLGSELSSRLDFLDSVPQSVSSQPSCFAPLSFPKKECSTYAELNQETLKNSRNRARAKKSSKSSDLMTIAETACSYREPINSNSSHSTWCGWNQDGRNTDHSKLKDTRYAKNREDCNRCYMCQDKGCKPDWKDKSLNDTYVYDPGIEEFILDDNELSTSRFYGDLNFDWPGSPRSKSPAKKSVKSVSIIDTLSELVSGNQEQRRLRNAGDTQSSVSTPGILKVRDVKNRSKKKNKQQFLHHKRLSSSLPLLNIPDEKRANETEAEPRMSDQKEDKTTWRSSDDQFGVSSTPQRHGANKKSGRSKLTKRLSSFERAHTPDWLAQIFDVAKKGRLQELKHLLEGMDGTLIMNLCDRHGNNLLHISCYYNHLNCLKWLLGVNPDSQQALMDENKSGLTPVVVAAKRGRQECVEWLVNNTISRDQICRDDGSRPLLHHAAKYGQVKVVEWIALFMLKTGQSIDAPDHSGCTALHLAARYGKILTVKFLVMHGSDLIEKDSRGFRAYDHAVQHGQRECAEFILCMESSLSLASDVISLDNEFKGLKTENSEMKSCFKETLSLAKKLIKERELLRQQLRSIHGGCYHLNEALSLEGTSIEGSHTSGTNTDELKKLISNVSSNLQNSQINSPSDEHMKKMYGIEERWRRLRLRNHSKAYNEITKPIDVIRHQETQVKLKAGPEKSTMEFDSSSESALSSPESDRSNDSCAEDSRTKFEQPDSSQVYGMMKNSSHASSKNSSSKIKDYRKFSGNTCPTFITGELAAAVRQSRRAQSKGKEASKEKSTDKSNFLIRAEGQTCSVLEVLDPSSDDENFVDSKSFLVKSDASVSGQSKVSMKIRKNYVQNATCSNQRRQKKEDPAQSTHQLKGKKGRDIPDLHDKSSKRLSKVKDDSDHQRRRRSPRLMTNRCAKSDIEDLDGPDFDDICVANLPESVRFSEPDLIKGTKEVVQHNQSVESIAETVEQPTSNIDRLSISVSVASSANVEVQFPSVSSTSDSSVNSIGAILDSSSLYQTSTPIKKKGFFLKFQTLKKRWPSRHKFTPNKKSQEITPEDFKETYMRPPGETKESSRGIVESADERSECDRLSSVPRQRESVCSASSTSSNKLDIGNQKANMLLDNRKESPKPEMLSKRPPVPELPLEVPTDIPPPLFLGTHRDLDKKSSDISGECSINEDSGLISNLSCSASKSDSMSRPASSASRMAFCPQIVTATAETVKAASAAAGFPLHKSSSLSTDLLSPDSSTAGRLSPAPSEISKTESALSPPSDVSKTESTRHLNQLEKIEEIKQVNASLMDKAVDSFEKDKGSDRTQTSEDGKDLKERLSRDHIVEAPKRVRIQKSEKPWYEVSDDEDMPSPSRYEMVATAAMCSSSEDERIDLHTVAA